MNIIDKINNIIFDFQIKRKFKLCGHKERYCKYCGKHIKVGNRFKKGEEHFVFVGADDEAYFECYNCGQKIDEIREQSEKEFCPTWKICGHAPNLERCLDCKDCAKCGQYVKDKIEKEMNNNEV